MEMLKDNGNEIVWWLYSIVEVELKNWDLCMNVKCETDWV